MGREDIISKVQKLLNLARNGGATPAEAASAAKQAQRLIVKYHLEEAELKQQGKSVDEEAIEVFPLEPDRTPGPFPDWWKFLAHGLTKPFMCTNYHVRGHGQFVVGRRTDVEAFRYTFLYLRTEVIRLAEEGWRNLPFTYREFESPVRWKRSFCVGAVHIISDRLEALHKQETAGPETTTAIVLRSRYDEADAFMRKDSKLRTQKVHTTYTRSGIEQGRAAGRSIPLGGAQDSLGETPLPRLPGGK